MYQNIFSKYSEFFILRRQLCILTLRGSAISLRLKRIFLLSGMILFNISIITNRTRNMFAGNIIRQPALLIPLSGKLMFD
jgi:hypothetical protein